MKDIDVRNRPGLTFPELIWAIVIIGAIAVGLLAFFGVGALRNAALIDVADITLTGVRGLTVDGSSETYMVTVKLSKPVPSAVRLQIRIYEDDFGPDELLDDVVQVDIRAGATTGTGQFMLSCENEENSGPDDENLKGEDGEDDDETGSTYEIYGEVVPDNVVQGGGTSSLKLVTCNRPQAEG